MLSCAGEKQIVAADLCVAQPIIFQAEAQDEEKQSLELTCTGAFYESYKSPELLPRLISVFCGSKWAIAGCVQLYH